MTRNIAQTLHESLVAYSDGDYAAAVDILFPRRYDVKHIGGSNLQVSLYQVSLYGYYRGLLLLYHNYTHIDSQKQFMLLLNVM